MWQGDASAEKRAFLCGPVFDRSSRVRILPEATTEDRRRRGALFLVSYVFYVSYVWCLSYVWCVPYVSCGVAAVRRCAL
ncbi:hypothetical protein C6Y14_39335 [Streptomyces dioscori]|uniref:Uncharacterized protein n=1 Tax=Streptomyces dioscori TaxID=2109333 RepID=A0A2P8PV42_9ACTN|nr:hypothetical protein C6Y14_39335 [Streptomyces dioscori]